MPVMRGTELVARLRSELGLAELPAFVLSSSDSIGDIEVALSSGANGYILKCESEADYLDIVRWLEECCRQIERGCSLADGTDFSKNRPSQLIAGPVAYRSYH
jgi:CheY-like chemotaxis protein